jgi:hypothetical protein
MGPSIAWLKLGDAWRTLRIVSLRLSVVWLAFSESSAR